MTIPRVRPVLLENIINNQWITATETNKENEVYVLADNIPDWL